MAAAASKSNSVLVISIDVTASVCDSRAIAGTVCPFLLERLNLHGLPATWAVDEPAEWLLGKQLADSPVGHEVALLGDASWIGCGAARATFAQELSRRTMAARAAGLQMTSLVPYDTAVDDHLDLLVKHEVTAVRGLVDLDARAKSPAQPHPLHYGLWETPGSLALPGRRRWLPGGGLGWTARRRIDRASRSGHAFHLVIDAGALDDAGLPAQRVCEKVLSHVAQRRDEGRLHVLTLSQLAVRLTPNRQSAPSRSILRAAG